METRVPLAWKIFAKEAISMQYRARSATVQFKHLTNIGNKNELVPFGERHVLLMGLGVAIVVMNRHFKYPLLYEIAL